MCNYARTSRSSLVTAAIVKVDFDHRRFADREKHDIKPPYLVPRIGDTCMSIDTGKGARTEDMWWYSPCQTHGAF